MSNTVLDATPIAPLSTARRGVDTAYAVLTGLFVAALLVQISLAGLGAFGHGFTAHEDLGNVLGIAAVVLFVLAAVARVDRRTVIGAFVVGLLTEVAQHGLAANGHDHAWAGALHALSGMVILLTSAWLAVAAYRRVSGR